jgi:hypothetical protein
MSIHRHHIWHRWEDEADQLVHQPLLWITIGFFLVMLLLLAFGMMAEIPEDAPTIPQYWGPWGTHI